MKLCRTCLIKNSGIVLLAKGRAVLVSSCGGGGEPYIRQIFAFSSGDFRQFCFIHDRFFWGGVAPPMPPRVAPLLLGGTRAGGPAWLGPPLTLLGNCARPGPSLPCPSPTRPISKILIKSILHSHIFSGHSSFLLTLKLEYFGNS